MSFDISQLFKGLAVTEFQVDEYIKKNIHNVSSRIQKRSQVGLKKLSIIMLQLSTFKKEPVHSGFIFQN